MRFMLVDDDNSMLLLIRSLLEEEGDEVICEASNGEEAIETYKSLASKPDIIIMDIHMPKMNGLEAGRIIRKLQAGEKRNNHLPCSPILFLTGSVNEELLTECFSVGDDVLQKPISNIMAKAKINSIKRNLMQFRELGRKQKALHNLNRLHEEEFSLARDIFSHFASLNNNTSGNIKYHTSPSTTFSGDIVLCTRSPMNSLYVLIGDLTGHGLPAAISATPINKIFFTMASKGISISKIAQEINHNLFHLLPDNIFCAAFLLEMTADGKKVHLWGGGMPSLFITDAKGHFKKTVPSMHMPLGSQNPSEFESNIKTILLQKDERLYLFTDGVTEAQNNAGEMFGETGIRKILNVPSKSHFNSILSTLENFSPDEQHDDTTLVELISQPLQWTETAEISYLKDKKRQLDTALPWEICMRLSGKDFQRGDPASQLVQFLNNAAGIDMHQDTLSTILTELYSNALEHGLLNLDSNLKKDEEGFVEYYLIRNESLHHIKDDQQVEIHLAFTPYEPMPQIKIKITDTGRGFDTNELMATEENDLHGRGQALIHSLCHELVYSNGGRTAMATYNLLNPH